jgi:hypothetical protein
LIETDTPSSIPDSSTKREAKTLTGVLRILAQSAETIISAGGMETQPPQILKLYNLLF